MCVSPSDSIYGKNNVIENIKHFILGRGLGGIAGFLIVILIARYSSVSVYATFTVLTGIISMVGMFSSMGVERVLTRFLPEAKLNHTPKTLRNFILIVTSFRVAVVSLITLCLCLVWGLLPTLIDKVSLGPFSVVIAIFMIAETMFQHFSTIFQSLVEQRSLTRVMAIQWMGRLILLAYFLSHSTTLSIDQIFLAMLIPEVLGVVTFIGLLSLKIQRLDLRVESNRHWPNWNEVTKAAIHNYGFCILSYPPQSAFIRLVAGAFLPTHLIAAYGFFSSLMEKGRQYLPLNFFYGLVEPVLIGQFIQHGDFSRLAENAKKLFLANLLVLMPAIAILLVAGKELVETLTTRSFLDERWLLILLVVQLISGSHIVLLQLITNALGLSKLLTRSSIFALVAMLIFWICALQVYPELLFFGPLVFSLLCNHLLIKQLNQLGYPYRFDFLIMLKTMVSALIAGLVSLPVLLALKYLSMSSLWLFLITSLIALFVFVVMILMTKAITKEDMVLIKHWKKTG